MNGSFSFFITLHAAVHNLGFVCKVSLWMGRTKTNVVITKDEHVASFPTLKLRIFYTGWMYLPSCIFLYESVIGLFWNSTRKLFYTLKLVLFVLVFCCTNIFLLYYANNKIEKILNSIFFMFLCEAFHWICIFFHLIIAPILALIKTYSISKQFKNKGLSVLLSILLYT